MKKRCYKEILRLFALFWVIYNHTWTYGWIRYTEMPNLTSIEAIHNLFLNEFCKIGVPIFLLISGSNLIGKEESIANVFKRRILRYIFVIVILHYTVYWVYLFLGATPRMNWKELLISLYSDSTFCPYYFYMYLAFLLILPILRLIAKNYEIGKYTIIILLFLGIVLNIFENLFGIPTNKVYSYLPYSEIVIYPLTGYYLDKIDEKYNKALAFFGITGLIMLLVSIGFDVRHFLTTGEYSSFGRYAFFLSCFVYLLIKKLCYITRIDDKMSEKTSKILFSISGATMLAFVISGTAFWKLIWIYDKLSPYLYKDLACEILVFATLVLSLLIGVIIRLIPGINKIL